jgi:hypothetical protein
LRDHDHIIFLKDIRLILPLLKQKFHYMAVTHASQEAIWLRQLLEQLGFKQKKPTSLLGDNHRAIALTKNPCNHPCTKHIQLRYHFIQFAVEDVYFTLPHTLRLDSTWTPAESRWTPFSPGGVYLNTTKCIFVWIIKPESIWSSPGVCIDSVWTLSRNAVEFGFIWAFYVLIL